MKKILALTCATMLLFSAMATSAFAVGGTVNTTPAYRDIQGDSEQTATIPVFGYVGEDATITDPDTGDPTKPPVVTAYQINVSVPVKIIWAAFQSEAPAITAPNYYLKNNSAVNTLDVTLSSFKARNTVANTAVDSKLTLNLTGAQMAKTGIFAAGNGYTGTTAFLTAFAPGAQWNFSLSGMYVGDFATPYTPVYDMTLTFALR
ncbi:MAG: hypothetical protein FWC54_01060 [Actinomycetia bacterium]|nr:hypothetical protein [Actinomycetes bacterium]